MGFHNLRDYLSSLFIITSTLIICAHSDVPRPRGVSLAKAALYSSTKDFTCFDGTITIPFNQVNDDYCDCFDGSDEPGTSACMNGVFHCENAGHRALNIPSSRVNDGVCDCCDGTDEYAASGVACLNTCDDLGREARAEAQRLAEVLKAGSQVRHQLIEKGNEKRGEMAQKLSQLEKDRVDADRIKDEKQALLKEIEEKENEVLKVYREAEEQEREKKLAEENEANKEEAIEIFNKFDSDSDGSLTIAEIQTRNTFDKNKDGEVSEEEAKYFLAEHNEVDIELFVDQAWPLMKPFLMREQGHFKPPPSADLDHEGDEEHEPEEEEEHEGEDLGEQEELDEDETNHEDFGTEPVEEEKSQKYDPETQAIVDEATEARKQVAEAESHVREIDSNIKNIKSSLEKDFGPNHEFATLDGECLEYEDKEYVYRLCLFDRVTQKSKNGGSEVGLGNWGEWAGDEHNVYSIMKYTNGMSCWNGPNRSTTVNIQCGLEIKMLSVSEPHRCEYMVVLSSPAACDDSRQHHEAHDEL